MPMQKAPAQDDRTRPAVRRRTYTIPEVAKILKLSRNGAYQQAKAGIIPTVRFGRMLRVTDVQLDQLLAGTASAERPPERHRLAREGAR